MAEWWKKTAWPWLKTNWWAVLLFPIALLVAILMFFMRGQKGVVLDPLREADERDEEERRVREQQLEEERERLRVRVEELEAATNSEQEHVERRIAEEVDALRNDPEALRERMLRVGPGRKP